MLLKLIIIFINRYSLNLLKLFTKRKIEQMKDLYKENNPISIYKI
mgnify:CR=1 FL=1